MKPTAGDSGPFLTWVVSIRPRLRSRDVRRTSGRPYLEVGSSTAAVPKCVARNARTFVSASRAAGSLYWSQWPRGLRMPGCNCATSKA